MIRQFYSILFSGAVLTSAQMGYACSMCFFGSPKDPANIALRGGVLTLLFILLGVLGGFIKFFLDIRKRSKLLT